MVCKKCRKLVRNDCVLTTGVCVFCHYHIRTWDSNGQLVTKKEACEPLRKDRFIVGFGTSEGTVLLGTQDRYGEIPLTLRKAKQVQKNYPGMVIYELQLYKVG